MGSLTATLNWLNLTTITGLAVAKATRCDITRRGAYYQATGYGYRYPLASAFTIGSVVIARRSLGDSVWTHEVGHVRQYAWCGPLFIPFYGFAAAWSWMRTGDWWSRNIFERRAGLAAGGYAERPLRRRWQRGGSGADAATA